MTLSQILRSVLDETDLVEPSDIAAEVLQRLPQEDREDAFQTTLTHWVRSRTSRERRGVPDELIGRAGGTSNLEQIEQDIPRISNRSTKVAGIRDWWTSFINERVQVEGDWKLMGDCTIPDVITLARDRRDIAARNAACADKFDALAREMRSVGATTVRSLDRERIKRSLAA